MAAANASARGQRAALLASPLHELTGFYLAVDCLAPRCNGERTFAVADLATGSLAGDRTDPQRTCQTPTGAALGAGGAGVALRNEPIAEQPVVRLRGDNTGAIRFVAARACGVNRIAQIKQETVGPRLPPLAGRPHWAGFHGQRLPGSDGPGAFPRLRGVGHVRISRRNSTVADNSPPHSKAVRIAAASASEMTNMPL
jgi:hypothetical protein